MMDIVVSKNYFLQNVPMRAHCAVTCPSDLQKFDLHFTPAKNFTMIDFMTKIILHEFCDRQEREFDGRKEMFDEQKKA